MHASARAFLNQIIDYAGLFPPAKLPLEQALGNYLRYKKESPYSWMLGRFVCPTTLLLELLKQARTHPDASLLSVSALGTQASQPDEVLRQIQSDMVAIQQFRFASAPILLDTYEVALPKDVPIEAVISQMESASWTECAAAVASMYWEIPTSATWRRDVEALLPCLEWMEEDFLPGLKIRCGGITAAAFPSDEQVAFFIRRCRDNLQPWKATAGLHHPRRHWDDELKLWHHGFLNVFGAGLLAATNDLTEPEIAAILADRDADFRFQDDQFSWKNWACTTAQITEWRSMVTSFGSCSFEEPVEDLIALGLLERA